MKTQEFLSSRSFPNRDLGESLGLRVPNVLAESVADENSRAMPPDAAELLESSPAEKNRGRDCPCSPFRFGADGREFSQRPPKAAKRRHPGGRDGGEISRDSDKLGQIRTRRSDGAARFFQKPPNAAKGRQHGAREGDEIFQDAAKVGQSSPRHSDRATPELKLLKNTTRPDKTRQARGRGIRFRPCHRYRDLSGHGGVDIEVFTHVACSDGAARFFQKPPNAAKGRQLSSERPRTSDRARRVG